MAFAQGWEDVFDESVCILYSLGSEIFLVMIRFFELPVLSPLLGL